MVGFFVPTLKVGKSTNPSPIPLQHCLFNEDTDHAIVDRNRKSLHRLSRISLALPDIDPKTVKGTLHGRTIELTFAQRCATVGATVINLRTAISHPEDCYA